MNFENYNIYKLTVLDTDGNEIQHYYLNSMPAGTGTNFENHDTFPEGYTAVIPVMGAGSILLHQSDRNCHAIDNCGIGSRSVTCDPTSGRNIPNEPSVVIPATYLGTPMENFNTRNGANQPFHAQGMHLTVTDVQLMPSVIAKLGVRRNRRGLRAAPRSRRDIVGCKAGVSPAQKVISRATRKPPPRSGSRSAPPRLHQLVSPPPQVTVRQRARLGARHRWARRGLLPAPAFGDGQPGSAPLALTRSSP